MKITAFLLLFFSLFFSCENILINFASVDQYKFSKKTVDSFYIKNYKTDMKTQYANKTSIESVWKNGGMPLIYIIDSLNQKIKINNCFANFENYIFASIGVKENLDDIKSIKLSKKDKLILGSQLNMLDTINKFKYTIFYYWSILIENETKGDSVAEGILFKTFNRGQKIIDSLESNKNVRIIPVNVDFISEEWSDKEIRNVFKAMLNK